MGQFLTSSEPSLHTIKVFTSLWGIQRASKGISESPPSPTSIKTNTNKKISGVESCVAPKIEIFGPSLFTVKVIRGSSLISPFYDIYLSLFLSFSGFSIIKKSWRGYFKANKMQKIASTYVNIACFGNKYGGQTTIQRNVSRVGTSVWIHRWFITVRVCVFSSRADLF